VKRISSDYTNSRILLIPGSGIGAVFPDFSGCSVLVADEMRTATRLNFPTPARRSA
jgi:hypothetical protein